jgi:hypothetical protein
MTLILPHVGDFEIDGLGRAPAWQKAQWQDLARTGAGPSAYRTRLKALWSDAGIYLLFDCEDRRLTCTITEHMGDLFLEDVVEAFFWPDEGQIVYFEYELSPLGFELPILVANSGSRFHGWLPWHFTGPRRTRFAVGVRGGPQAPGAAVEGWTAEVFLPFALMTGLGNTPPEAGRTWRANFYRIDYDAAPASHWAWHEIAGGNFHDYRNFGTIRFGK